MDPQNPAQPSPPAWPPPSLGPPAPGNVPARPPHDAADTQPVGPGAGRAPGAAPPTGGGPAPGSDAYAQETRAIYRDGQRLLYYAVNFARFLMPERVYGHRRIYESVEALAFLRLHGALGRLVRAQMPLARGGAEGELPWRDLLLHLENRGAIQSAEATFLNEVTRLRQRLVSGELVAVDIEMLIRLSQLGDRIFAQLDPAYQRPDLDPEKDALPAAPRQGPEGAPAGAGSRRAGATRTLDDDRGATRQIPIPDARPTRQVPIPDEAASGPPTGRMAAGAQRPGIPLEPPLYCPSCGRPVLPDDLWCPRCGANFTAPGAAQPLPVPPPLGSGATPKRRGIFARFLGR